MATITQRGNPIETSGELPAVGSEAPNFSLTTTKLQDVSAEAFTGKTVILNIFPSLDTGVCATSVRRFNSEVAGKEDVAVLCVSRDLPFAHNRFCTTEGIQNVTPLSELRDRKFGADYGLEIQSGSMRGLLARAVVVVAPDGTVKYTELVPEITQEPNYAAALAAV